MILDIENPVEKPIRSYIGDDLVWVDTAGFTPAELFIDGEQGIWLDPSDLSTMYQDARGLNPVTKDGDPVGLILDKSQGLTDASYIDYDLFELNPELSSSVATITHVDGSIVYDIIALSTSNSIYMPTTFSEGLGKVFAVTMDIENLSSSNIEIKPERYGGAPTIITLKGYEHLRYSFILKSTSSTDPGLYLRTSNAKVKVNSVRIKEVKGNHATQVTAASRPIYRTDGELHWLEFDGVDDSLDVNVTATNNFDLSLSFNYKGRATGATFLLGYNGSSLLFGSTTNAYFNLFGVANGALEDTDRRNHGIKVITAYVSPNESNYIGQSGEILNLATGVGRTISSLSIGSRSVFDVYGFLFRDSSLSYPDISKQIHSYMQRKAGEEI